MTDLLRATSPLNLAPVRPVPTLLAVGVALALAGCVPGGSSGGGASSGGGSGSSGASCPVVGSDAGCNGSCSQTDAAAFLTAAEVNAILDQALAEALAIEGGGATATVAVVDRVGNVLGVKTLGAAGQTVTVDSAPLVGGGALEDVTVPATAAAIAKAITGAYLSSEGNAFTTRTANFIVQDHYPAGVDNVPGGPLFGVQFSQLPCSDLTTDTTFDGTTATSLGPHRSPLGLAADPGGLPLYKNGALVGGIGAMADGVYGIDRNVLDTDAPATNIDERVALAGSRGFEAPTDRRADRITVDGILLPFADASPGQLTTAPPAAPTGALEAVAGYFDGVTVRDGTRFTTLESGFQPADDNFVANGPGARTLDAFVLTNAGGTNRFLPAAGTLLSQGEVAQLLRNALAVANRSFGQIRRPLCSQARVTVSVVDTNGDILGIARTRDAPVFGTDVSLQKARSALFFSSADTPTVLTDATLGAYATDYANFDASGGLTTRAFGARSGGNLSRPFFPDGINANRNGPFGEPLASWSPFNTGLQSDLVTLAFNGGGGAALLAANTQCTLPGSGGTRLANGLQIFSGGVPIYKGGVLAGAIGASGDGIEQDDMVVFLGLHEAGVTLGGTIGNAPPGIRIDQVDFTVLGPGNTPTGTTRIRYVQCPFQPFIGSEESNPCNGK